MTGALLGGCLGAALQASRLLRAPSCGNLEIPDFSASASNLEGAVCQRVLAVLAARGDVGGAQASAPGAEGCGTSQGRPERRPPLAQSAVSLRHACARRAPP